MVNPGSRRGLRRRSAALRAFGRAGVEVREAVTTHAGHARELSLEAQAVFDRLGIRNVTPLVGDGSKGWPDQAPFDRIIVTAAAKLPPQPLIDQLAPGGILICPVGDEPDDQVLVKYRKTEHGLEQERLAGVRFVPLIEGRTG